MVRIVDRPALGEELVGAPVGADLGRGGNEDLHIGVGADGGADVAAVEHGALGPGGEGTLEIEQRRPHPGVDGEAGGKFAGLVAAQVGIAEERRIEHARHPLRGRRVVRVEAPVGHQLAGQAVEQTGVEIRQAVVSRQTLGERSLAGGRRTVDGDDHGRRGQALRRARESGIGKVGPETGHQRAEVRKAGRDRPGVVDGYGFL